jgi:putative ABC transport system permease protein
MIAQQLKNIFRIFLKRKTISGIMILSLFVGFTTVFLLTEFVFNEYTVDSFHKNKNRIVRLQSDDPWVTGQKMNHITFAVPEYLKNNFPEVQDYCHWNKQVYEQIIANKNIYNQNLALFETNPEFFNLFTYQFIEGNQASALLGNNVVLSEKTAHLFFGDRKALGNPIIIKINGVEKIYTISAVVTQPGKSHIQFDMVTSINGKELRGTDAYLLLKENTDHKKLEEKINIQKSNIPFFWEGKTVNLYLNDLKSINITSEVKSKIFVSLSIAAIILFISFFNYINLFINLIMDRGKELGLIRIIGGTNKILIIKLGFEFSTLILIALLLSTLSLRPIIPYFNHLNGNNLLFSNFFQPQLLIIILGIVCIVIILSYFTIYLFLKNPLKSSKGTITSGIVIRKNGKLSVVNAIQYTISIVLIICTITLYRQINFIHNKPIGIDRDVIEFRLPAPFGDKNQTFKNSLLSHSIIEKVSVCSSSPLKEAAMIRWKYDDKGEKKEYTTLFFQGDENYINTLHIELIEGGEINTTAIHENKQCYINETMSKFHQLKDPIGKILPGSEMEIAGIVKDFHWNGFESLVPPAVIVANNEGRNLLVKIKKGREKEGIGIIQSVWKELIPNYPLEYETIGELFNQKHKKYEILVQFISFYCIISIILSSMGILAMSLFSIRRKVKEIGIRKVNGANLLEVLVMINHDLVRWNIVGFMLACPIAGYLMHKWLENFAYKTTLSWWIFALAGLLALGIALLTVSWQSWSAAKRNPITALRYE